MMTSLLREATPAEQKVKLSELQGEKDEDLEEIFMDPPPVPRDDLKRDGLCRL